MKREQMSVGDAQDEGNIELEDFYDFLYGSREGYVYAATKKDQDNTTWKQHFFQWPVQRAELVNFTVLSRSQKDVYVAPALFHESVLTKERGTELKPHTLGADVVWVELDGPPATVDGIPSPTCRISSGGDGHEHWYWKVDTVLNSDQLDLVNSSLTYLLEADLSGWDSVQVLRPPNTFNHKRKRRTAQISKSDVVLDVRLFGSVPPPPTKVSVEAPQYVPPIEQVIAKYKFPDAVSKLFFSHDPADRSNALMTLGYHCAEMAMVPPEIFAMLLNADERWGKFKGRADRVQRLQEIVSIAITKYPNTPSKAVSSVNLVPMGFSTLLRTEVKLEWQWEGFLQQNGYYLLTGPTGVGKTQFSLDCAGHMALGKPFLGKPMEQARVGFFSLEMGLVDLKYFLQQMQFGFTLEEQEVLEDNLQIFALGEPLYMTNDTVREQLDQLIGDYKLDGIMVDSLGSATDESVSDEKFKKFFHWNDTVRQKHDIFTWYIHHHRKANGDNRKPNKISDVYGSQYITSYATTVGCLWDAGFPNMMNYIPLKMRLAPRPAPFLIMRDQHLHFVRAEQKVPGAPALGSPSLALGAGQSPGGGAGTGPVPAGQQAATQGVSGQVTTPGQVANGQWSVGPKSAEDVVINMSFGDVK